MSGPTEIVLILAAVAYLLTRRVMGEPAEAKRMLVLPIVLSLIGLSDLSGQVKTASSLVFLVVTGVISVVIGLLRGVSVRVSRRGGVAFVRYRWVTVLLWVVNLVVKLGANLALGMVDSYDAGAVSNSLMLTLGLGILAEGLVVLYRALRNDHPVTWVRGQGGAPHQMSTFLDELRHGLTHRGDDPYDDSPAAGWNTRSDRLGDHRR